MIIIFNLRLLTLLLYSPVHCEVGLFMLKGLFPVMPFEPRFSFLSTGFEDSEICDIPGRRLTLMCVSVCVIKLHPHTDV